MENRTENISSELSGALYVPDWLIGAFDSVIHAGDSVASFASPAGRLLPRLNIEEISSLALLMTHLQLEFLESKKMEFDLSTSELEKGFFGSKAANMGLGRVLSGLSGVGLVGEQGKVIRLFEDISWIETVSGYRVRGRTSIQNAGHVLGYYNAFQGGNPLETQEPLTLWRSLWLDVKGFERSLFVRLEKKMQWDRSWVDIGGVCLSDLTELFDGLKIKKYKKQSVTLKDRIKMVRGLGEKMVSHGVLRDETSPSYLALSSQEKKEAGVLWQLHPTYLGEGYQESYRQAVAQFYSQSVLENGLSQKLMGILSLVEESDLRQRIERFLSELRGNGGTSTYLAEGAHLLSGLEIFLEWAIRREIASGAFQLPEELKGHELLDLTVADENLMLQNFRKWCGAIEEEQLQFVFERELFTVASKISGRLESVKVLGEQAKIPLVQSEKPKPRGLKTQMISNESMEFGKSVAPKTVPRSSKDEQSYKYVRGELLRMQQTSPKSYLDLLALYLQSQDANSRRMIELSRKSLGKTKFDQVMRDRIVKFMIENPSSWTSP